jgi:hypothetical protein
MLLTIRTNMLPPSSENFRYTQKMAMVVEPKILVILYQTARCHTQVDRNIGIYRCKGLIFQLIPLF